MFIKLRADKETCTLFAMELSRFLFLMALHHKTFECFDDSSFCLFFFSEKMFACKNNVHIPYSKKCNGVYDCRWVKPLNSYDFSDEKHCRKSP